MSPVPMFAALLAILAASAQPVAIEQRRLPAADARQGVAAGDGALFAIDNRAIARLDAATGKVVARWEGDPARFQHLNSCIVARRALICAASNYPDLPMQSRIETFDARTLAHRATRTLAGDIGSLTWLDRHRGGWWAGFANYDGKAGAPGRDHTATKLVRYDAAFHETGRWRFPGAVLDRFAPRSNSGGAWGKDGLLYVTGHDRPELYALRVPAEPGELDLIATIATPTGGQAIGWDPAAPRLLWTIERRRHEIVASTIPQVAR